MHQYHGLLLLVLPEERQKGRTWNSGLKTCMFDVGEQSLPIVMVEPGQQATLLGYFLISGGSAAAKKVQMGST